MEPRLRDSVARRFELSVSCFERSVTEMLRLWYSMPVAVSNELWLSYFGMLRREMLRLGLWLGYCGMSMKDMLRP